MFMQQIVTLLEFCLKHTCFLFEGEYYKQVHGATMGSPISPFFANLFMEEFEVKVLSSVPHPPHLWLGYMDDTFVIQEAKHSQQLFQHINSQDPHIQFTTEEPNQEGALPSLDTLVSPGPNNTLITNVYRKPTHTPNIYTGTATTLSQQKIVSLKL